MNPNSFLKPDRGELARLAKDDFRRHIYTGSLALIQDLLCEFSKNRGGPRFLDENVLIDRLAELSAPIGGASVLVPDDSIQQNIVENLGVALNLRKKARADRGGGGRIGLRAEIEEFLDSLEETYGDLLRLMAGGLQSTRPKRA